jgi:hypothetical protein
MYLSIIWSMVISCTTSVPQIERRTSTIELYQTTPLLISKSSSDSTVGLVSLPPVGAGSVYRQALLLYTTTAGRQDSLAMTIVSSGTSTTALSTIAKCVIPRDIDPTSMRIGLEQGNIFTVHPAMMLAESDEPLVLSPFIQRSSAIRSPDDDDQQPFDLYMIGVEAMRMRLVDGEYLPSSEDIRVFIRQGLKVFWQSNAGMSYLTVISPVRPERPGEHSLYSVEWTGTDSFGTPLPPGEYTADILIPAKPAPYQTQITFSWPLSRK